jgi:hypothetical protein
MEPQYGKLFLHDCIHIKKIFKNLLQNYRTRKAKIDMKAVRHSTKASLLKSWHLVAPRGSGGAITEETAFTFAYTRGCDNNRFSWYGAQNISICQFCQ